MLGYEGSCDLDIIYYFGLSYVLFSLHYLLNFDSAMNSWVALLLGKNQALNFNKTPSARIVIEYLGCHPQRVNFQVPVFNSSGSI